MLFCKFTCEFIIFALNVSVVIFDTHINGISLSYISSIVFSIFLVISELLVIFFILSLLTVFVSFGIASHIFCFFHRAKSFLSFFVVDENVFSIKLLFNEKESDSVSARFFIIISCLSVGIQLLDKYSFNF
jgi:hypothetical protein